METLSPKKERKAERKKLLKRHDYQEDLLKRETNKKKKEFYHIVHFPDSLDDTTCHPALLTLFAMTDPA